MIKVLIVDDSKIMQESIAYILKTDPEFEIVGYASNGKEAIELTQKYSPDVITMDWQMPIVNGYEATKEIMETNPTPIVVVTGSMAANDVSISFSLIEAGALVVLKKPHGLKHSSFENDSIELIQTLKLMSEIKLVRRIKNNKENDSKNRNEGDSLKENRYKLIVVGASTGGPIALQKLLTSLPSYISAPILIVQHISAGFVKGFVEWLMNSTNYPIHVACEGEEALAGHVYVAPDNYHMGIDSHLRIFLSDDAPENGLRPAVSYLFKSCANYLGNKTIAVLLSGMGKDGSEELKLLKDQGCLTYAQDEKSSVVHGMPGEAIKIGGACHIYPPEEIGKSIQKVLSNYK